MGRTISIGAQYFEHLIEGHSFYVDKIHFIKEWWEIKDFVTLITRPSDQAEPERFYHGLVLGLIVDLQGRYVITSNRESGYGRYDIMMEPLRYNDPAFILEFKVFNPNKESGLEDTVASALHQIEDKEYGAQLRERGISDEHIRKYGFAFEGKRVLIG